MTPATSLVIVELIHRWGHEVHAADVDPADVEWIATLAVSQLSTDDPRRALAVLDGQDMTEDDGRRPPFTAAPPHVHARSAGAA